MLNEKEKVIFKILEKNNFNEIKNNKNVYKSLEELLNKEAKDVLSAFYIGTENRRELLEEDGYLYFFDEDFLEIKKLSEEYVVSLINEKNFIEKYKKENGENDELYIQYVEACI